KIDLTGVLVNNSQVVADGFRDNRTLDLSSFSRVTSTMDNPRFNGTNGYFARRKGRLALPPLHFTAGTSTQTWGDDNADPFIDMVNSVRVTVNDSHEDGLVRIALLSTMRDDIPTLPE